MTKTSKARAKDARRDELQTAVLRLQNRNDRISITAVARVVGVTPALIHNTYPDVAEHIRSLIGKHSRARQDELRAELSLLREANRKLTLEKESAEADARKLASLLEALRFDLAHAQAVASTKVRNIRAEK